MNSFFLRKTFGYWIFIAGWSIWQHTDAPVFKNVGSGIYVLFVVIDFFFVICCYLQEAKKGMATAGKVNVTPVEEKVPDDEPLVYANKQVAF